MVDGLERAFGRNPTNNFNLPTGLSIGGIDRLSNNACDLRSLRWTQGHDFARVSIASDTLDAIDDCKFEDVLAQSIFINRLVLVKRTKGGWEHPGPFMITPVRHLSLSLTIVLPVGPRWSVDWSSNL